MNGPRLVFRATGVALGVVGLFLLVTGVVRLADDAPGVGGPVARLVCGLLLVSAGVAVVALGMRRTRAVGPVQVEPHVETVTCPHCGTENPPSVKFCTACRTPLR